MLQGICTDTGHTTVLEMGKSYYLFPNGTQHYYVSIFPNQDAHKGCFQSKYFQIIEKDAWPPEPKVKMFQLDRKKKYKAELIWRRPGYKNVELKEYFIKPLKTHCDFYHDSNFSKSGGCFPLHWFNNFTEVQPGAIEHEISDFDTKSSKNDPVYLENEPKTIKYVQLSLFD
jgi:hypothetical protein